MSGVSNLIDGVNKYIEAHKYKLDKYYKKLESGSKSYIDADDFAEEVGKILTVSYTHLDVYKRQELRGR